MTFFASPDRALRLELLSYLPQIIKPMDQKTLVEIWGHIETGFSDNVPAIREGTLKAILHLMDKVTNAHRKTNTLALIMFQASR